VLSKRLPASEARLVVIASALLVFSHTTTKFTVSPHEHCLQKEMRADHEAVALHTISDVALLHWTSATLLAGERLPRDDASDANAKRKHDRKKDLLHNHLFFLIQGYLPEPGCQMVGRYSATTAARAPTGGPRTRVSFVQPVY
jgi:hypothetical protein